jgi:hypothetical protein
MLSSGGLHCRASLRCHCTVLRLAAHGVSCWAAVRALLMFERQLICDVRALARMLPYERLWVLSGHTVGWKTHVFSACG